MSRRADLATAQAQLREALVLLADRRARMKDMAAENLDLRLANTALRAGNAELRDAIERLARTVGLDLARLDQAPVVSAPDHDGCKCPMWNHDAQGCRTHGCGCLITPWSAVVARKAASVGEFQPVGGGA